jgi:hypothetical protein
LGDPLGSTSEDYKTGEATLWVVPFSTALVFALCPSSLSLPGSEKLGSVERKDSGIKAHPFRAVRTNI